MYYAFFWVIPRRLNFICQRFGTLCLFHLHRRVGTYLPAYEDGNSDAVELPRRKHRGLHKLFTKYVQNLKYG